MATENTTAPNGRERPRAPRVDSAHTSMSAASAAANPFAALDRFKLGGFSPLHCTDLDGARDLMEQAVCLLTVVASGWENEQPNDVRSENLSTMNPTIHVSALKGISTLVALASCYVKEAQA